MTSRRAFLAGLELVALQLYPTALVEPELARTIRLCREAGTNRINVAWFKGSAENPNDWQLLADVVNHAAEVCAAEGIAVGYHNHQTSGDRPQRGFWRG